MWASQLRVNSLYNIKFYLMFYPLGQQIRQASESTCTVFVFDSYPTIRQQTGPLQCQKLILKNKQIWQIDIWLALKFSNDII